jgi:hypothetical protein
MIVKVHGRKSFLRIEAHFVKKLPTFYETRRFITLFTTARHEYLS